MPEILSINTIPVLVDNDSDRAWLSQVRIYLRSISSLDVIEVSTVEPYRAASERRAGRAGSVPPTVIEDDEAKVKKWERWQKKESLVQTALIAIVDDGLKRRIEDLPSAIEMWEFPAKV